MRKNYGYKDIDGHHWPDATKGDQLWYSIYVGDWLSKENDTIVSVNWDVPEGLENLEERVSGAEVFIKIGSPIVGTFKVSANFTFTEDDAEQVKVVPMILKVF